MGDSDSLTAQISRRLSAVITTAKGTRSMSALRDQMVAAGCPVREQELSRWRKGPESGYAIPELDRMPSVARGLEVRLAWLLTGEGESGGAVGVDPIPPSKGPPSPPPAEARDKSRPSLAADTKGKGRR